METQGVNASAAHVATTLDSVADTPLEQVGGTAVQVDGRTFYVGKLNLNQITALARIALDAASRMSAEQRKQLTQALDERTANLAALLSLLDQSTIAGLFGVILRTSDTDWLGEHMGPIDVLDVVDALLEQNDWELLPEAFFRLARRGQKSRTEP